MITSRVSDPAALRGKRRHSPAPGERRTRPGAAVAAPDAGRGPILAKLTLLLLLFPATFTFGSLSLTPARLLFLIVVPVLLVNVVRGAYGRFLLPDALVLAYAAWMTMAIFLSHPAMVAVEFTGSSTLNLLGGYLTARASVRTKADFISLIKFLSAVIILSFPFVIYESITSEPVIIDAIDRLSNLVTYPDIQHEPRLGLWRSQFVFEHPIHYGLFCSVAFSLVFVGLRRTIGSFRRIATSAIIALCCFLSVSSGPFLALASQLGLIAWAHAASWSKSRWRLLGILLFIGYAIIEVASNRSGIYAVVSRLSFSGSTAFARRVLFEHGIQQIGRAPMFGVGHNPWPLPAWMTGSVDNFWLMLAVAYGVPAFVFFAGAFLAALIPIGRREFGHDEELMLLRRAWMFMMIGLSLTMATVAVWGAMLSIVMLMFASGQWMLTVETAPAPGGAAAVPRRRASVGPGQPETGRLRAARQPN